MIGDWRQQVVLEGAYHNRTEVLSGVPKDTVFGPLLFPAYINDLPLRSKMQDFFADGSLPYSTVIGAKDNTLLQEDIAALDEWERLWQMSFNPSECAVVRVTAGRRKAVYHSSYRLHGPDVEVVDSSKYIRVKVTSDLTWSR